MKCRAICRELSAYLDGELSARQHRTIDEHLEQCPGCREQLAALKKTVSLMGTLEPPTPPHGFTEAVQRSIDKQIAAGEQLPARTWTRRLFFPLRVKLPIEAFASIIILMAVLLYPWSGKRPALREEEPEMLPVVSGETAAPGPSRPAGRPADPDVTEGYFGKSSYRKMESPAPGKSGAARNKTGSDTANEAIGGRRREPAAPDDLRGSQTAAGQEWDRDAHAELGEMKQADFRARAVQKEKPAGSLVRGDQTDDKLRRIAQYQDGNRQFLARDLEAEEKDNVIYQRVQVVMEDIPGNRLKLETMNGKWQALQEREETSGREARAKDRVELRGTNDFQVTLAEEEYIGFIRALAAIGEIYMSPIYSGTLLEEKAFAGLLDSFGMPAPDGEEGISHHKLDKEGMEASLEARGPETAKKLAKLNLMYNNYDLNVVSSRAEAGAAEIRAREAEVSETEK